ncbi:MAG: HEPN domain-containing protein [Chloroflexota bacterium]
MVATRRLRIGRSALRRYEKRKRQAVGTGGEDLKTAEALIEASRYYAAVFFSEQAAEKALKVVYLERERRPAFTHDLVELADELVLMTACARRLRS